MSKFNVTAASTQSAAKVVNGSGTATKLISIWGTWTGVVTVEGSTAGMGTEFAPLDGAVFADTDAPVIKAWPINSDMQVRVSTDPTFTGSVFVEIA